MSQIFCFGDIIIYGKWGPEGGWVKRLKKNINRMGEPLKRYDRIIFNLGISGNTTEDVLKRFESEIEQRLSTDSDRLIFFGIGINDAQFSHLIQANKVPAKQFEENISQLIKKAVSLKCKILFVGLTPVNEKLVDPIPWSPDFSYKNKYIKQYDNYLSDICNKQSQYFIDIFNELRKTDYLRLSEDGIHPNAEGHRKIFEIVKNFTVTNNVINYI